MIVGKVHGVKFCTYCGKYAQHIISFEEDGEKLLWTLCFTPGCDSDDYPNTFKQEDFNRYLTVAKPTKYTKAWIKDNGEVLLKA